MAFDPHASASVPPFKPWERTPPSSGPTPFKSPSNGSTSNVVEASGTANPGKIVSTVNRGVTAKAVTLSRTLPARPWEQQNHISTYRGYNPGYNSSLYGSSYHGLYVNHGMYRGGYGRGMYNNDFGGPMGANTMAMVPHGGHDPNSAPVSPPAFWVSLLQKVQGIVTFCSNIAMLIDDNTRCLHIFMSALFMLLDRAGFLYGELTRLESRRRLARFVFGILGIRRKFGRAAAVLLPGHGNQSFVEGHKASANETSWDTAWGGEGR